MARVRVMTKPGGKRMFRQILVAGVTGGLIAFVLSAIAALIAATILAMMVTTTTYGGRIGIMCLLGVFAFGYLEPQYWNWYGFPATYTITRVFGGVATWTIAGAAMAAI